MNIYNYQEAFGAADITSDAMKKAMESWYALYYAQEGTKHENPCQRIAYTVVAKLVKTIFGEYQTRCEGTLSPKAVQALNRVSREAVQQMLVGGECYLKPWVQAQGVGVGVIPRCNLLIFGRNERGEPVDVGSAEQIIRGKHYYTLLERRYLDSQGHTVIENRLFRSLNRQNLGVQVPLTQLEEYAHLNAQYRYPMPLGNLGLIRMKNPTMNCVDGSADGVAVYAAAVELIRAIDENEAQLQGEFRRGESRIIVSGDLLNEGQLTDHLFVGLDDDPQSVGITVFSPQLREQSFLNRKHEYLRNVESLIGLKRGMLSDANAEQKTATEIASSAGDFNLTVIDFQKVWEQALMEAVVLCTNLASAQGMGVKAEALPTVDWGNGILYDEDKTWADYVDMVSRGLLRPEYALGWRFGLPTETEQQLQLIRTKYMPNSTEPMSLN